MKIAIVGAGNISNTRHIPALKLQAEVEIIGVVSNDFAKIERTLKKYTSISHSLILNDSSSIEEQLAECVWFINEVDAVIIGTPPREHYRLVKACLNLNKHVLVEKPFVMLPDEATELRKISNDNNLILMIMHSFQYSPGMLRLKKRFSEGEFGEIKSIFEVQLTNRNRRLPKWYNDLPLGLFFDEAAHFFYTARYFGGELEFLNANAFMNNNENTPRHLQVQLMAGSTPVQMYMNFNSPICEWLFILIGEKKIAVYDYFKDILIVLDNDNQHLSKDVLLTFFSFIRQYITGFIFSGFKMSLGKLLYGHDYAVKLFINSIKTGEISFELSSDLGYEVIKAMNDVVKAVDRGSL